MVKRNTWIKGAVLAVLMYGGWGSTASATVIFSDNFDTVTNGSSILNWSGGSNWDVRHGSVDLVKSGEFGISCLYAGGYCVDMDGSTQDAGNLISMNLGPLGPGDYQFSYWLSGNQRTYKGDVTVALARGDGSVLSSAKQVLDGADGWSQFVQTFTLTDLMTNPVKLQFRERGGDNIGALLDDVRLTMTDVVVKVPKTDVPEPASFVVLALGVLLLLGARRDRAA